MCNVQVTRFLYEGGLGEWNIGTPICREATKASKHFIRELQQQWWWAIRAFHRNIFFLPVSEFLRALFIIDLLCFSFAKVEMF
jgi:hypothetical protein